MSLQQGRKMELDKSLTDKEVLTLTRETLPKLLRESGGKLGGYAEYCARAQTAVEARSLVADLAEPMREKHWEIAMAWLLVEAIPATEDFLRDLCAMTMVFVEIEEAVTGVRCSTNYEEAYANAIERIKGNTGARS